MKSSLVIGPLNQASQGNIWAYALRQQLGFNARSVDKYGFIASRLNPGRIDDPAQLHLPHPKLSSESRRTRSFRELLLDTDFLLAESNQPFIHSPKEKTFIEEWQDSKIKLPNSAIVFHGSDIRNPELAADLNPHSFFKELPTDLLRHLETTTKKNRLQAVDSGLPLFVTTADLLEHLPGSQILPVSIDVSLWQAHNSHNPEERRPLTVLHMPSNSSIKGTKYILPVLEKLEARGDICVIKSDRVPRHKMPALYSKADIYIDQIQTGSYGVSALEALSMGCVVVGNIPSPVYRNLKLNPIIESNPANFEEVLTSLVHDIPRIRMLQTLGPEFVRSNHGPSQVCAAICSGWLTRTTER